MQRWRRWWRWLRAEADRAVSRVQRISRIVRRASTTILLRLSIATATTVTALDVGRSTVNR